MSSGRLLARNSALNVLGFAVPLAVAVAAIPVLIRGFGAERFAVLALASAAVGYFNLFEFGLGRALTQAVAQRLGNGARNELGAISWTTLALQAALGVVGGAALALATPSLVGSVLQVPAALQRETAVVFWIMAASLPLVVANSGLRGLMEAHEDFGLATALRVPLGAFTYVGPAVMLLFSRSLIPAAFALLAGRIVGFSLHLYFCVRRYDYLRSGITFGRASIVPLLRFGGWATVSNIVSPIMVSMDRFFIGALLPLAAVAHYATPYEAVTKALLVPLALAGAVFPAFAASVDNDRERMRQLYTRSLRMAVFVMFPVALLAVAFARDGLTLWMGSLLPAESVRVLQLLAVGVFLNGIAQTPHGALQSAARPDVVAQLHLVELPLYGIAIYFLTRAFGLTGVALAWTLRVTVDMVVLLILSRRILSLPATLGVAGDALFAGLLASLAGAAWWTGSWQRLIFVAAVLAAFVPLAWSALFSAHERTAILQMLRRGTSSAQASA